MAWDPNQGQDPNQSSQYGSGYGGYTPPPPQPQSTDPYSGQQSGYGQPGQPAGGYGQPDSGYSQPGGYGQPDSGYSPPGGYGQQYGQQQQAGYQYQQPYGATGATGAAGASGPTTMGLQPNVAAALSYIGLWVTGLIFFFIEKQNRYVRFNAAQSIVLFGGITVLGIILSTAGGFAGAFLGTALGCLGFLIDFGGFVAWIVLLINAFQGKNFRLPIVADVADRLLAQFPNT